MPRFDEHKQRGLCFHPSMKKKHAERKWTVMVVPHGSGSSRAVEVSQTVVKALVGIGGVVALGFLVLGGTALSRGVNVTRSRALERETDEVGLVVGLACVRVDVGHFEVLGERAIGRRSNVGRGRDGDHAFCHLRRQTRALPVSRGRLR